MLARVAADAIDGLPLRVPAGAPKLARIEARRSGCDGAGHRLDAEGVEGAAQIVGELGAHIGEAAHQKGALIHPGLMLPNGCSTISRRRSRISGLIFEGDARRNTNC
jgi:hypothetical protein